MLDEPELLARALAAYVVKVDADGRARIVHATDRARTLGIVEGDALAPLVASDRALLVDARATLGKAEAHTTTARLELGALPVRLEERVTKRDASGAPVELVGVVGEASESPVESLRFLTDLLNTVPDPVFVKDRAHRWIAFNESFCQLIGRTRGELLNKTDRDFFPPDQVAVFYEHDDKVFASSDVDQNEEELTDAQAVVHTIVTRKAAFRDPEGNPVLVGVIHDVTDKKLVERALINATRAKSAFVANVSHELRTPLNGILGMTQLLARRPLGPVELEYLDVISASGEALLALVDDVLDFSKIEAGHLELERRAFNPTATIEDACAVFAAAAAQRGIELVVRCAPDLPSRMTGDDARLRQIVINLVGNAVKFTPSGGEVVVDAGIFGGASLRIVVADTGIGLDQETKARLFTPFTQADASVTRRFGGTGLGLAISQRLAVLMGGEIRADGEPGRGSAFTVAIPAEITAPAIPPPPLSLVKTARIDLENATARAHLAAELARLGVGVAGSHLETGVTGGVSVGAAALGAPADEDSAASRLENVIFVDAARAGAIHAAGAQVIAVGAEAALESAAARHLVKPIRRARLEAALRSFDQLPSAPAERARLSGRALVVEDSPVNEKVLVLMLTHVGVVVEVARNGLQAIDRLTGAGAGGSAGFDVVLMDCQMPELDGIEAARRIRQSDSPARGIPIIAVTADATAEAAEQCLRAGMNAIVHKPVRLEELVEVVGRFVPAQAGREW